MLIALAIIWGIIAYFVIGVLCCKAMQKMTHKLRWRSWYIDSLNEFAVFTAVWPLCTLWIVIGALVAYPFSTYSNSKKIDVIYRWVTK